MTTEQRKEELKRREEMQDKFDKFILGWILSPNEISNIFNFFYSEIEAREKEIKDLEASEDELCTKVRKEQEEAVRIYNQGEERDKIRLAELQHLEEIIKAADELIKCYPKNGLSEKYGYDYEQALEHYNKLKSKLPSGI